MILRMDHFTIVSDQLEATRNFYVGVLGLVEGPRPPFPVPGFWLYTQEQPVLHVVGVSQMPEPRRGVLDHMAFHAQGLQRMWKHLSEHGVRFKVIRAPAPSARGSCSSRTPMGLKWSWISTPAKCRPPTGKNAGVAKSIRHSCRRRSANFAR